MKSKHYSYLLGLFIMALSYQPLSAQLVANGDFESWTAGVVDGWTDLDVGYSLAEESTILHGGSSSAAFNIMTGTQGDTDFRQTISVVAGTNYDVSFWAYHTEGGMRVRLYIEDYRDYTMPELTGQWQELTYVYEATTTGDIEVGLRFYDVSGFDMEEIVYIDDFTVTSQVVVDPTITFLSPQAGSDVLSSDFNIEFLVQNFMVGMPGGSMIDGSIAYSLDGGMEVDHFTTDPIAVTGVTTGMHELILTLKDNGGTALTGSGADTISFNLPEVTDVADIATLRSSPEGAYYRLTGEAILTYQQGFRGQKFIQDATAGILIDEPNWPGFVVITTPYNVNDGITGLVGELTSFGGMLQLAPGLNPAAATSTNNPIPEQVITLADLVNNFEDHESEVVTIKNVTFEDAGATFVNGEEYLISDSGTPSYRFRASFFDVDYIDGMVPSMVNVSGIPHSRNNEGDFFAARNLADFDIFSSTEDLSQTNFSIFPNPNNGVFTIVNEGITGRYTFEFTDLLGQKVYTTQQQLINGQQTEIVSKIQTPGMYFVRMSNTANGYIRTLPLIIE